nr:PDZ domain-containing protein [candidate division Zixibacteria bacterium]
MRNNKLIILLAFFLALPLFSSAALATENPGAWLGIYTQTIDNNLKEAFNLDTDHGVVIKMLIPDSPADKAGLKQGDIILSFDGEKLADADQLIAAMKQHKDGDKVTLDIFRKGKEKQVEIVLGRRLDQDKADQLYQWYGLNNLPKTYSKSYKFSNSSMADTYIGVNLQDLGPQLAEYFGVGDGTGALIAEVIPESPAEKAGLKAGDVIVKIDGNLVGELSDVQQAVWEKEKGDKIKLTVLRDKKEQEFSLEVDESPAGHSLGRLDGLPGFDQDFLFMPRMKGLFRGNTDNDLFDSRDFKEQMEQLREQLDQLREQMKEMQEKMD